MNREKIMPITLEFANVIVEKFDRIYDGNKNNEMFEDNEMGLFLVKDNDYKGYLAIDNTTGQCWCESYHNKEVAIKYLYGMGAEEAFALDKKLSQKMEA
ncbi:MAG: hypothetical protein ABF991_00075 [Liquorilactobacillus hordei]|uniref:hypothetical protein n=1 Tax=Liquorilactobacillus hordei TaxID=468911 RepID=UPI0039EC87E2